MIKKTEVSTGEIDFVLPWVDGNDPAWMEEKAKYPPSGASDAGTVRYRDWGNLVYWFRGVEAFAPWVNRVFLVTWGHVPEWLNRNHPKLRIVNHEDFIPEAYRPTFNSTAIALNLHRISKLSDNFVYFDDDIFLIRQTSPADFFARGKPCDISSYSPLLPDQQLITRTVYNNVAVINQHHRKNIAFTFRPDNVANLNSKQLLSSALMAPFGLIASYDNPHLAISFQKGLFDEVWKSAFDVLDQTSRQRFRHPDGVNPWLMRYWYLARGEFSARSRRFGRYFEIRDDNRRMLKCIRRQEVKMVCCNDTSRVTNFERARLDLVDALRSILPNRSSFEL